MKYFFRDRLIIITGLLSLVINGFIWWLLYNKFHNQTEYIPLHYNIYFGIDLFGPWYKILLIPLTGLIIIFINIVFSFIIYKRVKIFSYFLMIALSLGQIILLGSSWLIVSELIT